MGTVKVDNLVNQSGDQDSGLDLATNDQVKVKTANTTRVTVTDAATTVANTLTASTGITVSDGDITMASGHGISFAATSDGSGATVSSEVLSEYEEGTWALGLTALGDSGSTITVAEYTRVGRIVHLFFNITIVSTTDTSPIQISGLPFDGDGNKIQTQPNPFNNLGLGDLGLYVQGTTIYIGKSHTFTDVTYANASGKYIRANVTYQVL